MYQCPKCRAEDKYTDSWHRLGRIRYCTECKGSEVVVRSVDHKNSPPGEGRPAMSKKDRKKFRTFVKENFSDDELIKAFT